MEQWVAAERAKIVCLICGMNPLERRDFDGLCLSCRACVADNLYRIEWVYPEPGARHWQTWIERRKRIVVTKPFRVVVFANRSEHPLGTEWPNWIDPIPYRPEDVRDAWRRIDRQVEDEGAARERLARLTELGSPHEPPEPEPVANRNTELVPPVTEQGERAPLRKGRRVRKGSR